MRILKGEPPYKCLGRDTAGKKEGHRERYYWRGEKRQVEGLQKKAALSALGRGVRDRGETRKGRTGNLKKPPYRIWEGGEWGSGGARSPARVRRIGPLRPFVALPVGTPRAGRPVPSETWRRRERGVAARKGAAIVVYWLQTTMALRYRRATGSGRTAPCVRKRGTDARWGAVRREKGGDRRADTAAVFRALPAFAAGAGHL
ncbi:hypothetical protein HMPREF0262_01425 [Clostridium sp. ATCC 29733]|nr:hypothetical protein HMPREF0262_01425 [Clostridium sp. ATCC 29733]